MRWKAGRVLAEWHLWFAWYPIRMRGNWVWLETIYRRVNVNEGGGWSIAYENNIGYTPEG